jgi:hypothetical protein
MKVAVFTVYNKDYSDIAKVTLPVMERYTQKHGYDFYQMFLKEGTHWAYKKHELFKDAVKFSANVFFYLDIDCLITDLNRKVESFLDEEHSLFITEDKTEINGGSLILKANKEGMFLNDSILGLKDNFENEQNAMVWLMGDPAFSKHVKLLPHPSINSYLYELYPEYGKLTPEEGQWEPGQFILHTPALGLDKRAEILSSIKVIE